MVVFTFTFTFNFLTPRAFIEKLRGSYTGADMVVGVEVLNDANTQILTTDSLNSRAVFRGRSVYAPWMSGGFNQIIDIVLPYPYLKEEVPVILIRPDEFGKYLGTTNYSTYFPPIDGSTYGTGCITIQGQCPFDMLVFSTKGTPLLRDGSAMFETYDENENVVFSDRFIFPQLKRLIHRPATTGNTGWPMLTNISDLGIVGKPWFMANPLFLSGKGVGETQEYGGSTCMAILADGVTVSTTYRWDGDPADKRFYDPYADRVANFWVASISG